MELYETAWSDFGRDHKKMKFENLHSTSAPFELLNFSQISGTLLINDQRHAPNVTGFICKIRLYDVS